MDHEARLWELTPYDLQRQPQPIPEDSDEVIQTTGRLLEKELQCAICLSLLRNTRTTKECLHRFCEDCIKQAIRNGNKECPNCRTKLISMRSLRPDPLFDNIIATIFPNRQEMEEQDAALLAKISSATNGHGRKRKVAENGEDKVHQGHAPSVASNSSSHTSLGDSRKEKVTMLLSTCPEKPIAPKYSNFVQRFKPTAPRRLVTDANGTVSHVASFILERIYVEAGVARVGPDDSEANKVEIFLRKDGSLIPLEFATSLETVRSKIWKSTTQPVPICFTFKPDLKLKIKSSTAK